LINSHLFAIGVTLHRPDERVFLRGDRAGLHCHAGVSFNCGKAHVDALDRVALIELPLDEGFHQPPGYRAPGLRLQREVAGAQVDELKKLMEERQIGVLPAQRLGGTTGAVVVETGLRSGTVGLLANLPRELSGEQGLDLF